MENEHCNWGCSGEYFETGNKEKKTCPANEWAISVRGDRTHTDSTKSRILQPIEQIMTKDVVKQANLTRSEVIAVVLYTGPMVSWMSSSTQKAVPDRLISL